MKIKLTPFSVPNVTNIKLKPLSLADVECVFQLLAERGNRRAAARSECGLQVLEEVIYEHGVPQAVELSLRKGDAIELLEIILEEHTERLDDDDEARTLISLFDTLAPMIPHGPKLDRARVEAQDRRTLWQLLAAAKAEKDGRERGRLLKMYDDIFQKIRFDSDLCSIRELFRAGAI